MYKYKVFTILLSMLCLFFPTAAFFFCSQEIPPAIKKRMIYTWCSSAPVPFNSLRYITLSHYDFEGQVQHGELIVHYAVVDDLRYVFSRLFEEQFPIHSMLLVDEFQGSDDASMSANNTSAFYARTVADTKRWSNHAYGLAIDINPVQNPYSKGEFFCPMEGEPYLDRSQIAPGMITKESLIYKLFKERGWDWGGECFYQRDGVIDRHHFQKELAEGYSSSTL